LSVKKLSLKLSGLPKFNFICNYNMPTRNNKNSLNKFLKNATPAVMSNEFRGLKRNNYTNEKNFLSNASRRSILLRLGPNLIQNVLNLSNAEVIHHFFMKSKRRVIKNAANRSRAARNRH
jgi:hypothetical protein